MNNKVWVVEQRYEDDGMICHRVRHLASSQADAESWIDSHPDLHRDDYWFAVWEQPVDARAHNVSPHQFYNRDGEKQDGQPINHDAENRRAEQGGLTTNNPRETNGGTVG
ncbi:MAG: hypothetical protein ABEK50_11910 [bacterium]